jgi:hypothetical protein
LIKLAKFVNLLKRLTYLRGNLSIIFTGCKGAAKPVNLWVIMKAISQSDWKQSRAVGLKPIPLESAGTLG